MKVEEKIVLRGYHYFENYFLSLGNVEKILVLIIFYMLSVSYPYFLGIRAIDNLPCLHSPFPVLFALRIIVPKITKWNMSPCLQFERHVARYGDVYQMLFGNKIIVVANSYKSVEKLWCSNNVKSNNSRPVGYSFHKLLSKGVYTIGTTPMGENYARSRKHVSQNVLNEKRNKDYNYLIMNESCDKMINRLIMKSDKNIINDDLVKEAQYFHLMVALWVTYGFELDPKDFNHQKLADEMIYVENKITKIRSHIQNFQDYLPLFLKYIYDFTSNNKKECEKLYKLRQEYLINFYKYSQTLFKEINKNEYLVDSKYDLDTKKHIIDSKKQSLMFKYFENNEINELQDTDTPKVSIEELTSECLTMVSAGLDNTPLNFKYGIHMLVNYHPEIWNKAYNELIQLFDMNREKAYNECCENLDCEYMKAIVCETLRMFTVLPMALPRETTDILRYKNAIIPAKTTLFMNCWAANHDSNEFIDPMKFLPERWLIDQRDKENGEVKYVINNKMKHFSFGVGCRKCLGNFFAFRELYILYSKLILKFEIEQQRYPPEGKPSWNPLELNQFPESLAIEPYPFNIRLKVRSMIDEDPIEINALSFEEV